MNGYALFFPHLVVYVFVSLYNHEKLAVHLSSHKTKMEEIRGSRDIFREKGERIAFVETVETKA